MLEADSLNSLKVSKKLRLVNYLKYYCSNNQSLILVANHLSKNSLKVLEYMYDVSLLMFYACYSSSTGQTATLEEFQRVLYAINLDCLVPLAPRIFELFDYNHDGWIDLREVVCGFSLLRSSRTDDALEFCFKVNQVDPLQYIFAAIVRTRFLPHGLTGLFSTRLEFMTQYRALLFCRCMMTTIQASFPRMNWLEFSGYVTLHKCIACEH